MGSTFVKSKLGLVAVLKDKNEVCVIDEDSLKVTHRHRVDGAVRVASSPALAIAVVSDERNAKLSTVNLKTGRVQHVLVAFELRDIPRSVKRSPKIATTPWVNI